jgi:hypothetical protein
MGRGACPASHFLLKEAVRNLKNVRNRRAQQVGYVAKRLLSES